MKSTYSYSNLIIALSFIVIFFLPSFLRNYLSATSMTAGIIVVIGVVFALRLADQRRYSVKIEYLKLYLGIITLILCSGAQSILRYDNFELRRFVTFFMLLLLFVIAEYIYSFYLRSISGRSFAFALKIVALILVLDMLYLIISYVIFGGKKRPLLFTEISHLAIALIPFIFYYFLIYQADKKLKLFSYIQVFFLIMVSNLTLLVGFLYAIFIVLKVRHVAISLCGLMLFFPFIDLSYYVGRVDIYASYTNLSLAVFLTGWEQSLLNIRDTYGLGIGFQQLGYVGERGIYREFIDSLGFRTLNLYDGGTTGSKLISEFGFLGLILLCMYLTGLYKRRRVLKYLIRKCDQKQIFYVSCYFSFAIELFVRGFGYFNIGSFLFLIALINYKSTN